MKEFEKECLSFWKETYIAVMREIIAADPTHPDPELKASLIADQTLDLFKARLAKAHFAF